MTSEPGEFQESSEESYGGDEHGLSRQFFSVVPGAECSGPKFSFENTASFVSVQHPGEGGTVDKPVSLWADGEVALRPSAVLIPNEDPTKRVGLISQEKGSPNDPQN